ncbi:DUF4124 domain-containing protein [Dyella acidiphila]|uniref:DUF4124 domain-containing protein n=1 Tax=Dyella acidiphila TaxID=2775866 RepID=A0ABR9GEP2_9GAMM|nr:DUF4124 domain-containing protein [Dyella acidiphila]MBE1162513.1 DUF4124 domain-containing protein [Dyella acidiphila]
MHARWGILGLLLLMASTASGTDIYKCTGQNGAVSYADTPCPSQQATLLHKETAIEAAQAKQGHIANTLYAMVDSGHLDEARSFAAANGVSDLFQQRVQTNIRQEQEQRQQEVINDAQTRRANEAANQARHQQAMQEYQAKLVQADAEQEKFRKEHWSELKQQNPDKVLWGMAASFNQARGQWCTVGQDGSTVCH